MQWKSLIISISIQFYQDIGQTLKMGIFLCSKWVPKTFFMWTFSSSLLHKFFSVFSFFSPHFFRKNEKMNFPKKTKNFRFRPKSTPDHTIWSLQTFSQTKTKTKTADYNAHNCYRRICMSDFLSREPVNSKI